MPLIAFLIILLFGAGLFWFIAYLLRKRLPRVALALVGVGTLIALFLLGLWLVEITGWQREGFYKQLLYGLDKEELKEYVYRQDDLQETTIFMMSQSAIALHQMADLLDEPDPRIAKHMAWMAAYISDTDHFPLWKNKKKWEQQLFFLTQAAIILGHYQLYTGDEKYHLQWEELSIYLVMGISRSQYKHLASRPEDMALRPADNAAALYALKLYDDAYGTNYLDVAGEDWSEYIRRELQFEDTKLPCAGFTATNRCRLPPVGGSLALLNAYVAAADLPISTDFWREFRYYYKESFVNVFAWINVMGRGEEAPEFCDFSTAPLPCGRYEAAFAQFAAATREDWVTYYQLNNALLLDDMIHPPNKLWHEAPQEQVRGILNLAVRLSAISRPSND